MEIATVALICLQFFIMIFFIYVLNKCNEINKTQKKHKLFLSKVKHDIPILHKRLTDLEEQIVFPEENKLN